MDHAAPPLQSYKEIHLAASSVLQLASSDDLVFLLSHQSSIDADPPPLPLSAFETATTSLCSHPADDLQAKASVYSPNTKACFQAKLCDVLSRKVLSGEQSEAAPQIRFRADVKSTEIVWPLGLFLDNQLTVESKENHERGDESMDSTKVALLYLSILSCQILLRTHTSSCCCNDMCKR